MNRAVFGLSIALLFLAGANAADVAGVQVPESVSVQGKPLILNGAGVRSRFFVKVYVGALYLPAKHQTTEAVLAGEAPKSVRLHIVYSEIAGDQMNDALNEGFTGNNSDAELAALKARIERFRAMIPTVRRGDTVRFDLLAGGTTEVWVNDALRGSVAGADFQRALLKIWLGDRPADRRLKRAMLGQ